MSKQNLQDNRNAALAAGDKLYYTGRVCGKGHLSVRISANGACRECSRTYHRRKARELRKTQEHKDYQREYHAKYRLTENGKARLEAATERWLQKKARERNESKATTRS